MSQSGKGKPNKKIGKIQSPFLKADAQQEQPKPRVRRGKKKNNQREQLAQLRRQQRLAQLQNQRLNTPPNVVRRRGSTTDVEQTRIGASLGRSRNRSAADIEDVVTFRQAQGNYINNNVSTWASLITQGNSETDPFVAGIVRTLNAQNWPGEPPNIQIGSGNTTQAFYDRNSNTIEISASPPINVASLWDQVLFETQNALNANQFKNLDDRSNTKLNGQLSPMEYGRQKALIEYETNKTYLTTIRTIIESGDINLQDTSALAYRALKNDESQQQNSEFEKQREFISSPHDPSQIGKRRGLPTADLYAYEQVEGFEDLNWVGTRVNSLLEQAISNLPTKPGKQPVPLRNLWFQVTETTRQQLGAWPRGENKQSRPQYYTRLIDNLKQALTPLRDDGIQPALLGIDRTVAQRKVQWEIIMSKLDSLQLSDAAQTIALEEAAE